MEEPTLARCERARSRTVAGVDSALACSMLGEGRGVDSVLACSMLCSARREVWSCIGSIVRYLEIGLLRSAPLRDCREA